MIKEWGEATIAYYEFPELVPLCGTDVGNDWLIPSNHFYINSRTQFQWGDRGRG